MSLEHITWQEVIGDHVGQKLTWSVLEVDIANLTLVGNLKDPLFDDLPLRPGDDLSIRLGRHQLADLVRCLASQTLSCGGLGSGRLGAGTAGFSARGRRALIHPLILDAPVAAGPECLGHILGPGVDSPGPLQQFPGRDTILEQFLVVRRQRDGTLGVGFA